MELSELVMKRKSPEILKALKEDPTHVRGLRDRIGGSPSTIQSRIREMVEESLVSEKVQEEFPYKKILELTDKGRSVARILDSFEGIEQKRKIETIEFEEEKDRVKWPLAILLKWGEQGNTKMQKLIFLMKEEFGIDVPYDFNPYKHGPFSKELARDMGKLMTLNLVDPLESSYSLTSEGKETARELYESLDQTSKDTIDDLEKYEKMTLRSLLNYVYDIYPAKAGSPIKQE